MQDAVVNVALRDLSGPEKRYHVYFRPHIVCYHKYSKIVTVRTIRMAVIGPAALPLFCCLGMITL